MILISAVHIKRMRQMIEEQATVCVECSRKGSFLILKATWWRRRLEEVYLWRKLFARPYHWPWFKKFEDCLSQLLSEGYQLHVCSVVLHSIVLAISERNNGSRYLSAEDPESQIFPLCIPAVMDLIKQDIFGSASDIKEFEVMKKRLIKEASGVKSFNTL